MALNITALIQECLPVVLEAGKLVRQSWDAPHAAHHKGRIDLVTDTDAAVEQFLKQKLAQLLPEAAFLGEESSANMDDALREPLCWVVDPVDGTTNYVHHIPLVGVSVALCAKGEPIAGIVNAPMLDEIFYAGRGAGAFMNGKPIHVSEIADLADALACTGFPYDFGDNLGQILGRLERVLPATQGLRRPGAASLDLAWVACGRLDAFFEDGLKPWDMAAGWLIVEESGGKVSAFDGSAAGWGLSLLATNGHVHSGMVDLLRD